MTPPQRTLLEKYAEAVVKSPPHLHLTADRDPDKFWRRHIQDAIKILELVPPALLKKTMKVLDVGSGNGVPGIPWAILQENWAINLLDSDNKKCGFIDMFCNSNAIKNARCVAGRAETLAHGSMREGYGLVVARALAKAPVALEYAGAFVEVGGMLIVPRGTKRNEESASQAENVMGLKLTDVPSYRLDEYRFYVSIYKKERNTPISYPRAVGIPSKRPL